MNKWEQRRNILLEELTRHNRLSIREIQTLLQISESTARRLVVEMEQEHLAIRCFGGIQKISPSVPQYSYQISQDENAALKEQIGRCAANLVQDKDVIFLSGGSTVRYMAVALQQRIRLGELKNISIITNSLVSAQVLADDTEVIMPGGIYRRELEVTDGSLTEKNLRSMYFTKAFLGAVAVDCTEGFMTADIGTNSIDEIILSRAAAFYVLADSSKFGKHSFISYAAAKDAAAVITDRKLDSSVHQKLTESGAHILFS